MYDQKIFCSLTGGKIKMKPMYILAESTSNDELNFYQIDDELVIGLLEGLESRPFLDEPDPNKWYIGPVTQLPSRIFCQWAEEWWSVELWEPNTLMNDGYPRTLNEYHRLPVFPLTTIDNLKNGTTFKLSEGVKA